MNLVRGIRSRILEYRANMIASRVMAQVARTATCATVSEIRDAYKTYFSLRAAVAANDITAAQDLTETSRERYSDSVRRLVMIHYDLMIGLRRGYLYADTYDQIAKYMANTTGAYIIATQLAKIRRGLPVHSTDSTEDDFTNNV